MSRLKKKILQVFDRILYKGSYGQILLLVGLILVIYLLLCVVSRCCRIALSPGVADYPWQIRILELILDPGAFVSSHEYAGGDIIVICFQLFITIVGAVLFTSFLINSIGNWLDRRIEKVNKGRMTYPFDGHIVFFGANSMLETVLVALTSDKRNEGRDYVILTDGDVESVRDRIYAVLSEKFFRNVYVLYGDRTQMQSCENLCVSRAKSIYVLGEDGEAYHDARNLENLNLLTSLTFAGTGADCYLVLERMSSVRSFLGKNEPASTETLRITVINAIENLAQRVIVSRAYNPMINYPALDGTGIDAESDKQVHIVIYGMTQVASAMATTAAHICHFPNFRTKGIRTRITFVMENIRQEMDYFKGRYSTLMDLSYHSLVSFDKDGGKTVTAFYPKTEYLSDGGADDPKGFLDIEWEFVDAGIESEPVRTMLRESASSHAHGKEQLTVVVCGHSSESNVAASMCLPDEIYESRIPVFVYQPFSGEVMEYARMTDRYQSVFPFGFKADCFDAWLQTRLARARRVDYIYSHPDAVEMPADEALLPSWFGLKYAFQLSNLYAANSFETKLRSVRGENPDLMHPLSEEEIQTLAYIEHNRWNIERLLSGYSAVPAEIRKRMFAEAASSDAVVSAAAQAEHQAFKERFRHRDIAPYSEIGDNIKSIDRSMVSRILLMMK